MGLVIRPDTAVLGQVGLVIRPDTAVLGQVHLGGSSHVLTLLYLARCV